MSESETDDTTIRSIDYDRYDIDRLLSDINSEIGLDEEPDEVDAAFSKQKSADISICYRDPDENEYVRDKFSLEVEGYLWNAEIPIPPAEAARILEKLGGWHDEIGLNCSLEQVDAMGIDIEDYEVDDE